MFVRKKFPKYFHRKENIDNLTTYIHFEMVSATIAHEGNK